MAGWTDRWAEETGVSPAGPTQAPRCDQQRCLSSDGREPGVSGQGGRSQSAEREAARGGGEARGSGASGQPVCPIRDELASTGSPANPVRLRGGPPAREIQLCVWLFCDKKTDKAHTLPGAPWAGQRAGATLPGECHQPGSASGVLGSAGSVRTPGPWDLLRGRRNAGILVPLAADPDSPRSRLWARDSLWSEGRSRSRLEGCGSLWAASGGATVPSLHGEWEPSPTKWLS